MRFKLFIKPHKEEIVVAQVNKKSDFSIQLQQFVLSNGTSNEITAYDNKDLVLIKLTDLVMITIIENKVTALCNNNKNYHLKERLYQLTETLPSNFWRINKSTLVNKIYIERFEETNSSGVNIIMKNGLTDYVSRRCFSKIRKELNKNEKLS